MSSFDDQPASVPDEQYEQRDSLHVEFDDFDDDGDEQASELSSSSDVLSKIESFIAHWMEQIQTPGVNPMLLMATRGASGKTNGSQHGSQSTSLVQNRSLVSNQGAQCLGIGRVFLILEVSHELLRTNRTTTQRDIYYTLVRPPLVSSPSDVNTAIQDCCSLLGVTRASLGITCASRGSIAGLLMVKEPSLMSPWQDLSLTASGTNTSGYSISGSILHINSLSLELM